MTDHRIAVVASNAEAAQQALLGLRERYAVVPVDEADVIVALGGDGLMLRTLHRYMRLGKPVFGLNCGSVGFLMNRLELDGLGERLSKAQPVAIKPLHMTARTAAGEVREARAINEVSLLRETRQTAKLQIKVDGVVRLEELMCDGVLLATPAGSTAYNLSADGPILPLRANILALTSIVAFRPRRWRGAVLHNTAHVELEILEPTKRPVSAVADFTEVRDVRHVSIREDADYKLTLLFDPEHNLEERIVKEQFMP
ncbi:MAG: NAD kinase [Ectothiorhodospiraceae bacterium]|nr:NAD kinase [Ectothiorhodospiraceae bacterium]MCH8504426.1 NAD kinase [Ectothiorhodospiraceae bacterium]